MWAAWQYFLSNPETTQPGNVSFEALVVEKLDKLAVEIGPLVQNFVQKYYYTSENETRKTERNPQFRAQLFRFYYNVNLCPKTFHIKCMFTGVDIPISSIIASHLFKSKWRNDCQRMLDFEDIDDERNGLLLFAPIEHAFDRSHITFVYNKQKQRFVLKVLKPELSQLSFRDYIIQERDFDTNRLFLKENFGKKRKKYVQNLIALLDKKFQDFEGQPFAYNFIESKCFYRCLAFQQSMAMLMAVDKGWISKDEVQSPSMWSDLEQEKVDAVSSWLQRVKTASDSIELHD